MDISSEKTNKPIINNNKQGNNTESRRNINNKHNKMGQTINLVSNKMNLYSIQRYTCNCKSETYSRYINDQVDSGKNNNTSKLQYMTKKREKLFKGKHISNIEV